MINEDYFQSWHRIDLFSEKSNLKRYSSCSPIQSNGTRCGVCKQASKQWDQKASRKCLQKTVMVCVFDNRNVQLHGYQIGSVQVQQNWCVDFYVRSHIVGNLSACCICITKTKSHNWFCVSGEVLNTRFFSIQRKTWLLNERIPDMLGKSLSCMDIAKTWFGAVNTSHNDGMKAREVSRMTCTFMVFLFVLKRSRLPMFFASTIECC
jgi:hypothetical protein